jgi:nicotinamide riboside kinase
MENSYPLVITIVGAESSGKTMLAKQLAEALSCPWIPEYSREYLEKLGRPYEFEDLEEIARGQWEKILLHPSMGLSAHYPLKGLPPSPLKGLPPSPLKGVNNDSSDLKSISDFILMVKSLNKDVVIVDSGMLTIRMWARIKYSRAIPFVEEKMNQDPTSLYLLCRPRMEWERDPLREAPSLVDRVWIYNQYLKEVVKKKLPFLILAT